MRKALILAQSIHQYMGLMRTWRLNPAEYKYVRDWDDMCGFWVDMPVVMMEGYEYNKSYTVELMHNMVCRFENIGFLSEGEIWQDVYVDIQHFTQYEEDKNEGTIV